MQRSRVRDMVLCRESQNTESVPMVVFHRGQMWPFPNCNRNFHNTSRAGLDVHLSVHPSIPSRSPHTWSWDALLVGHLKMGL